MKPARKRFAAWRSFGSKPFGIARPNAVNDASGCDLSLSTIDRLIAPKYLALPEFDRQTEQHFWQERHQTATRTLKASLIIGIVGFTGYALFDFVRRNLDLFNLCAHLAVIVGLTGLLLLISYRRLTQRTLNRFAKTALLLSLINLLSTFWFSQNPQFYAETWASLLPMYFFAYGQLFLSLGEACLMGWSTSLLIPVCGLMLGVGYETLIPSIFVLITVNLFGFCTRWQLENSARHSFRQRQQAEDTAHDQTQFLRHIGHNLRQPLQAISCYSAIISRMDEQCTAHDGHPAIERLNSAVNELNGVFDQIFSLNNLQSGKQLPRIDRVELNTLLTSLQDQFQPLAAQRQLKLHVRLRSQPPFEIYSDATMLRQILANLLDNAIKYTRSGWIVLETSKIAPDQLKLRVADSGIGIHPQQQAEIFDEFYRAQRRASDHSDAGLGLGLNYVQTALRHLPGHTLKLYSKARFGSDFMLYLPVPTVTQGNPPLKSDVEPAALSGKSIWLVECNPVLLSALTETLQSSGARVEGLNSLKALQQLSNDCLNPPDLLISDYRIDADHTVVDALSIVQQAFAPIPSLVLSCHAIPEPIKQQLPPHVALLRKPASHKQIMLKLQRLLANHDAKQ